MRHRFTEYDFYSKEPSRISPIQAIRSLPLQTIKQGSKVPRGNPRIALYSPGMVGLGHIRRNLLIAQTLSQLPNRPVILMLAESREAGTFHVPPRVDFLTLPALRKDSDGNSEPRYLDISLRELISLRSKVIRSTLETFSPDIFLVDHLPRGAFHELDSTLEHLEAIGNTRCVLGLRDVLGDPDTVIQEWERAGNLDAIDRYYDAMWVYGDPAIYDIAKEHHLPSHISAKIKYTGYLDQRVRLQNVAVGDPLEGMGLPPGRLALCLVGGGQDGARLVEAFAKAVLPPDTNGVIVTGPFMSSECIQTLTFQISDHPRLRILQFVREPTVLLNRADLVVAMGGYNTVCEILSFEKRALIVPRFSRAPEQLIRAERFNQMGLVSVLYPDQLTPSALTSWLADDSLPERPTRQVDLNGLWRLPHLLQELLPASDEVRG